MISLKKNDKIIVIVAVVILVIAGVGIAMYQSPKTSNVPPSTITSEKNYDVTWAIRNGTLTTISEFAEKKSPYQGTVMIPEGNVKSITFNLSWTDDHMTFMKRMGLDSLTLDVTTPDGRTFSDTSTSAAITGEGTITYTVSTGIIPPVTPIKANNEKEAQGKLKGTAYYDESWANKNININVSVQIGELRIMKKLRDKGNDFDLKITYQYYDGALKEDTTKNTGGGSNTPPNDPWAEQEKPPYISMIINTGCGRYV
ncbi:MAG: hypothetical protein NTZ75_03625 [Euryarchaeota archaeon]|nr:hypothetical protein [Euryarchaeota archaeon]